MDWTLIISARQEKTLGCPSLEYSVVDFTLPNTGILFATGNGLQSMIYPQGVIQVTTILLTQFLGTELEDVFPRNCYPEDCIEALSVDR
jgi:hypothetical protein